MESINQNEEMRMAEVRKAFYEKLKTDFHVTTVFIPVKTVAAIIGISPSAIYGYIRDDIFFMPYRRLHNTPMIAVDDLVNWYFSDVDLKLSTHAGEATDQRRRIQEKVTTDLDPAPSSVPSPESARDRIVAEALAELAARRKKDRP